MRPDPSSPANPDTGPIGAALAAVARRIWIADGARAAAVAGLAAAAVSAARLPRGAAQAFAWGLVTLAIVWAIAAWRGRERRTPRAAAARIERSHPSLRNLLVTAEELRMHPARASGWMRDRVMRETAAHLDGLSLAGVVPMGRPLLMAMTAIAVWAAVLLGLPARAADALSAVVERVAEPARAESGIPHVVARLEAPAYTGVPVQEVENPVRLDAVAGSSLRLRLSGMDVRWRVRFGTVAVPLREDEGTVVAEMMLRESGYFAIEPDEGEASGGERRRILLPVSVTPDRPPVIRIDAPGRDLLLPSADTSIPVSATATDDFALASMELRYTKVSGSGEQFEFEEGVLPLTVSRGNDRAWTGQARLALGALKMAPGDALVYRAVGRDRRPGDAGQSSSDTFFVEIQGPGHVALDGIEMPPDEERYALSQQMVVLKIERLRAREARMPRPELEEEAAMIAAEQRSVRANFIFLMGGHVEDEFEEAEQSHEIQEGRLENSARKEISGAIHQMTLAEQGLTAISTGRALPPAKAAVEALQRAFGRNRYILRTLASRSRIDPSRRLSGDLAAAAGWRREVASADVDPVTRDARELLTRSLAIAAALDAGAPVAPSELAALAEQALRIDPASADWQAAAAKLLEVRDAIVAEQTPAAVAARLNAAIAPLVAAARKGARPARGPGVSPPGSLAGAWAEERRK